MKKVYLPLLLLLLLPLLVLDVLTSTNLAFGFRGIQDGDVFLCKKDCLLENVHSWDKACNGDLLFIYSVPWTAAGTYNGKLFTWNGETPIMRKGNIHEKFSWKSWYWEVTTTAGRSKSGYVYFSDFLKKSGFFEYLDNFVLETQPNEIKEK